MGGGGRVKLYFRDKKFLTFSYPTKFNKIYKKRFFGLSYEESKYYIEKEFLTYIGYKLDWNNLQTFNEKMQWYKLNYKNPLMTKCADKVGVREYIEEKLSKDYLVPVIKICDTIDEADFDNLPDKFVIKTNWGSGQNIIVENKALFNKQDAINKLKIWLEPQGNHYFSHLEWCYKDIVPKILIENYIDEIHDVVDYKFFCYNGEPKNMYVMKNYSKGKDKTTMDYYDMNFEPMEFTRASKRSFEPMQKPQLWDEMIRVSRILSAPFPFVRVDCYVANNQVKVGELTFYPGAGLEKIEPVEYDFELGRYLTIPQ